MGAFHVLRAALTSLDPTRVFRRVGINECCTFPRRISPHAAIVGVQCSLLRFPFHLPANEKITTASAQQPINLTLSTLRRDHGESSGKGGNKQTRQKQNAPFSLRRFSRTCRCFSSFLGSVRCAMTPKSASGRGSIIFLPRHPHSDLYALQVIGAIGSSCPEAKARVGR